MRRAAASEREMEGLGAGLAPVLEPGTIVYLHGPLGAGKTTLVRGLLRALGHTGPVKSPTYTLVESYQLSGRSLHHFDLYRLVDPEELELIGLRDYLGAAVWLIEWPERGAGVLPPADLEITIAYADAGRVTEWTAGSARGRRLLELLSA